MSKRYIKIFYQNLFPFFIVLAPAITISILAILYNPCVFLFLDSCALDLRWSLLFIWPAAVITLILFYFLYKKSFKKNVTRYLMAVIFAVITLFVTFLIFFGYLALFE